MKSLENSASESLLLPRKLSLHRPSLAARKRKLREYKSVYAQTEAEIGLFRDEAVANCAS